LGKSDVSGLTLILFKLVGNRKAAQPINAMLNYNYAILESLIRSARTRWLRSEEPRRQHERKPR
jgi:hypothetical protein